MNVQKATIADARRIHELVNGFAGRGEMLARALSEIYEDLRDYFVIKDSNDEILACVCAHIWWVDLAEMKSLAVVEEKHYQRLGSQLVGACLDEARELGIATVFCLTYKQRFFEKQGFHQVDKMELPHKIWAECYRCPKFPNCDEVALVFQFDSDTKGHDGT